MYCSASCYVFYLFIVIDCQFTHNLSYFFKATKALYAQDESRL